MTTKKRWTWIGALALLALCVYIFPFFVHPPGYRKDVDRVRPGMTVSEVEVILGSATKRIENDPQLLPPGFDLDYELADGCASISYTVDGKVQSVHWTKEEPRFWQTINWLRRRQEN
jgi:hypothetical protein